MVQSFQAVYENGVLRPLHPLDLKEHELVSLAVVAACDNGSTLPTAEQQQAQRQRDSLLRFIAKMEAIPDKSAADGFTNRDHDRLIYGS
jgi:predicted DNA-binding antitoxin AbrB/MazE fold protein